MRPVSSMSASPAGFFAPSVNVVSMLSTKLPSSPALAFASVAPSVKIAQSLPCPKLLSPPSKTLSSLSPSATASALPCSITTLFLTVSFKEMCKADSSSGGAKYTFSSSGFVPVSFPPSFPPSSSPIGSSAGLRLLSSSASLPIIPSMFLSCPPFPRIFTNTLAAFFTSSAASFVNSLRSFALLREFN